MEQTEAYAQFVNELKDKEIPYFNHRFLNKMEIHELMLNDESLRASIPDTIKLEDYDSFIAKLNEHQTIYVKPVNGSKGRGILRIEKEVDGFVVYYSSFSTSETTTFRSSYVLYKRLMERIKHLPYLIQQKIDLITIDDRSIDFRILCIKNTKGQWKVISSVARVSPEENMVSNIAQGGLQLKTFELLKDLYEPEQAKKYLSELHQFALNVANSLSSNDCLGLLGELGIDIGLDENGKLWLIEVNSKPSKIDDTKKRNDPTVNKGFTCLSVFDWRI
ncbi:MAG: YheC/YheD family protein [Bacillaceae bacterium]|nr:YheC/YheD family protein [Bacillaceae bacterium]